MCLLSLGKVFFFLPVLFFLKLFLQIDYCGEHKCFYKCDGTGLVVLENAQVSKTVSDWWQMEPRAGCRCASGTRKYFQDKYFFITRSAAAKMFQSLFRRFCLRKKFKQICLEDICNPQRRKKLEESMKTNCKKLLQLFLRQKVLVAFSKRKKQAKHKKGSAEE